MGEFAKNSRIVKERKQLLDQVEKSRSDKDLKDKCRISIKTVAIGALEELENSLGHLWGHGEKVKTVEQEKNRLLWERARTAILDRAEEATEKAFYHINRFEIKSKDSGRKFKTTFINKGEGGYGG
jgi:hypothetical protein